jgi:ribose transport system permease protein
MVSLQSPFPDPKWMLVAPGVWITLALAVVTAVALHRTVFGRHVFAIGSNESTARLCGVSVPRTRLLMYALAGVFVGVAGLFQFSVLEEGDPTGGVGKELRIIAAVVIGGGSLSGGRGSVLGTLCGALLMAVIDNGCSMLQIADPVQDLILGAIIISAVTLDQARQRRLAAG